MKSLLKRLFSKFMPKPLPMLVYRRAEQIKWSALDAEHLRTFLKTSTGLKLRAFQEDRMINAVLGGFAPEVVRGWRLAWQEIDKFKGVEPEPDESGDNDAPEEVSEETTSMQLYPE